MSDFESQLKEPVVLPSDKYGVTYQVTSLLVVGTPHPIRQLQQVWQTIHVLRLVLDAKVFFSFFFLAFQF